jgi:hypothetical protein
VIGNQTRVSFLEELKLVRYYCGYYLPIFQTEIMINDDECGAIGGMIGK